MILELRHQLLVQHYVVSEKSIQRRDASLGYQGISDTHKATEFHWFASRCSLYSFHSLDTFLPVTSLKTCSLYSTFFMLSFNS